MFDHRPFVLTAIPGLVGTLALLASAPGQAISSHHLFSVHGPYDASGASGISPGGWLGSSVAGVGDLNFDGYADFAAGGTLSTSATGDARAGVVRVYSGVNGSIMSEFYGDGPNDNLSTVHGVGDVNGDFFPDFVIAAPNGTVAANSKAGYVRMISGIDGTVIWEMKGINANDKVGARTVVAGDMNSDGVTDLIVSTLGVNEVRSGTNASLIGTAGSGVLGTGVFFLVGDVNNDGWPDIAHGDNRFAPGGKVEINSGQYIDTGASTQILYTILGPGGTGDDYGLTGTGFGGDINGDGFDDFVIGAKRTAIVTNSAVGKAFFHSGKDGALLLTITGTTTNEFLGGAMAAAGDTNLDGFPDVIIGAHRKRNSLSPRSGTSAPTGGGSALVYSGKDFSVLTEFKGATRVCRLGSSVAGVGDVNGDGYPDVIAGGPQWGEIDLALDKKIGIARVWSVKELALSSDNHDLSVTTAALTTALPAQIQTLKSVLTLTAGAAHANRFYFVVGSSTGTFPGVILGGSTLPLIIDSWTELSMSLSNGSFFVNTQGSLDGAGNATAELTATPPFIIPPAVIGVTLWHAYFVYDLSGFHATSNAVSWQIVQ